MLTTRRDLLKHASLSAGGLLLSPVVGKLRAEGAGFPGGTPKRIVFVLEGGGFVDGCVRPVGLRRDLIGTHAHRPRLGTIDEPLADYGLPSMLGPVAKYRDRITIIEGLSNRSTDTGHACNYGALGCYKAGGSPYSVGTAKGATVDVELGRRLPAIFPQLLLGIVAPKDATAVYGLSAMAADKPVPSICKPDFAYGQIFGTVAEGDARKRVLLQRNLLDFMIEDVKAARSALGGVGTAQMDPYLAAYEELRQRQSRLNEIQDTLRKHAPVASDKYRSEIEVDRIDAHFDIATAALTAGLTNVCTLNFAASYPYFAITYKGLGHTQTRHALGHNLGCEGLDALTLQTMIRRLEISLICRMMDKLDAVPEGDGTMLDNTLIVYMNEAGESHHATCKEWPLIVFGNWNGTLKLEGGRYLCWPEYGAPGHRTVANFYMSLLAAVGDRRQSFGEPDSHLLHLDLAGPLPEVYA